MRIDNGELGIDNGNFVIMKNLIISPAVEAEPQKSSRFSSFGRVVSSALIVANDDDDKDYDDVFWDTVGAPLFEAFLISKSVILVYF